MEVGRTTTGSTRVVSIIGLSGQEIDLTGDLSGNVTVSDIDQMTTIVTMNDIGTTEANVICASSSFQADGPTTAQELTVMGDASFTVSLEIMEQLQLEKNLRVNGDITSSGPLDSFNVQDFTIEDNKIVVNSDPSVAGRNGGFTVLNDEGGNAAAMVWDEANDVWTITRFTTDTTTEETNIIACNLNVEGAATTPNGDITSMPVGTVMVHSSETAPDGWLLADGGSYSTTTYATLFSVIGTTYGMDGAGTFRVPNLMGSTAVGQNAPGSPALFATQGQIGGACDVSLAEPQLPPHSHGFTSGGSSTPLQHYHRSAASTTPDPLNGTIDVNQITNAGAASPGTITAHGHSSDGASAGASPHNHPGTMTVGLTANNQATGSQPNNPGMNTDKNTVQYSLATPNSGPHTHPGANVASYNNSGPISGPTWNRAQAGSVNSQPGTASFGTPGSTGAHSHTGPGGFEGWTHSHTYGGHTHGTNFPSSIVSVQGSTINFPHAHNSPTQVTAAFDHGHNVSMMHTHTVSGTRQVNSIATPTSLAHTHAGTSDTCGSGAAIDVVNPFMALCWIIKC